MDKQRNLGIDLIRLVAAFGVVVIHLVPSDEFAHKFSLLFSIAAVPFFLMISLYFFIERRLCCMNRIA